MNRFILQQIQLSTVFLGYNPVFLPYLDEKQAWNLIILGVGSLGLQQGNFPKDKILKV